MLPAIFLDRDGVIIENRDQYVRSWADVEIFPQAIRALNQIALLPYRVVIITNQSAVGRGILSMEGAEAINQRLLAEIAARGGRIDGVYLCPHAPSEGCSCRKPEPGMLFQARDELQIELSRSVMIGDAVTDMQAGHKAGINKLALVRTGRGVRQEKLAERARSLPITFYEDLEHVVDHLFLAG